MVGTCRHFAILACALLRHEAVASRVRCGFATYFLSGAEAWLAHRGGRIDPDRFGVSGTENWGMGEIRGNLVRDLAARNKLEMLPWDDWGAMPAGYADTAGAGYDELLDWCARSCVEDNAADIVALGARAQLRVPDPLVSGGL